MPKITPLLLSALSIATLLTAGCAGRHRASPATRPAAAEPAKLEAAIALLDGKRPAWEQLEELHLVRHPYEKLLKGWIIVLDPGHGGDAHIPGFKKGPTGVREAEMNYRVAVLLQRLLEDAGATVMLTRDGDYDLSLAERAEYANRIPRPDGTQGADFFLSVHHNASDSPSANYTSVWYHGPVDRASVELDLARYIQLQLTDAIRTVVPARQTIFSDKQMYSRGFGVLNRSRVPSLLFEISFFSNPAEEQRLRDAVYNLRAAYAIYRGLCDYARGGRPTQSPPTVARSADGRATLSTTLDDGLAGGWGAELGRILPSTVDVSADGVSLPHTYDPATRRLTADLTNLPATATHVELRFANLWKHHNYPQRYRIVRGSATDTAADSAAPPLRLTPDGVSRDPAPPPSTRPATTRAADTRPGSGDPPGTTRPTPRPVPWK